MVYTGTERVFCPEMNSGSSESGHDSEVARDFKKVRMSASSSDGREVGSMEGEKKARWRRRLG